LAAGGVVEVRASTEQPVSTFDDREKGFEGKFAHDQELEFKAIARRNRMIGLWAAEKMGLEGEHREDYARAIIRSDFENADSDDVLRKLVQDLTASNTAVRESEIRQKMDEFLAQSREALKSEG
jgi:hypothetical protein